MYETNTLTITSPLISTMMACADPVMAQEAAVLSALQGAQTFSIDGDTLTITYTNADGVSGVITLVRVV